MNYEKILLGYHDKEPIYLSLPKWDCGWYWGWGYLGNNNSHYHISSLQKNCNLKEGFDKHFENTFIIKESQKWEFAELFSSFYKLKDIAEVYNRGGSHLTNNPCKVIIQNLDEVKRINEIVLPSIFEATYRIITQNLNNNELFQELVDLNVQGETEKVIDFMFEKNIKTDDLKSISKLNQWDFNNLHTSYWKRVHSNNSITI